MNSIYSTKQTVSVLVKVMFATSELHQATDDHVMMIL